MARSKVPRYFYGPQSMSDCQYDDDDNDVALKTLGIVIAIPGLNSQSRNPGLSYL